MYRDALEAKAVETITTERAGQMMVQISETMEAWLEENLNPTPQDMKMAHSRATEEAIAIWTNFQPMIHVDE